MIDAELASPLALADVEPSAYDAVMIPGGHGPMTDLYKDADLGRLLIAVDRAGKIIAPFCHGPAAPVSDGNLLTGQTSQFSEDVANEVIKALTRQHFAQDLQPGPTDRTRAYCTSTSPCPNRAELDAARQRALALDALVRMDRTEDEDEPLWVMSPPPATLLKSSSSRPLVAEPPSLAR